MGLCLSNSQQQIEEQKNEKKQDNKIVENISEEKQDKIDKQVIVTLREEEQQDVLKNQDKFKMANSLTYELFYGKDNIKPLKQYYHLVKPGISFESFVDKHKNENGYLLSLQEQKDVRFIKIQIVELKKMLGIKNEEEMHIPIQTHESKRLDIIRNEKQNELFYGKGKTEFSNIT